MRHPKTTSANSFALRIVSQGADNTYFFTSLQALARGLSQRVSAFSRRYPLTATSVSPDGTCLTWSRTTRYQAEHGHYGSIWRSRTESVTFEAFEFGRLLQIATVLNAAASTRKLRKPAHGDRGLGPIPWTRKYRGGGCGLRHPRTTAEMRINENVG